MQRGSNKEDSRASSQGAKDQKSSIRSVQTGELVPSDVSLTNVRKGNMLERALTQVGTQTNLYFERQADRAYRIIPNTSGFSPLKQATKNRQKGMQTEEPDG